ncbi:MAG: glycosyltransferase [Chloroflexi bacterium]|nr:glycosyltransferase [Chloroflexota bacterium]
MNSNTERQKWDDYYASLPDAAAEDEHTRQFRAEFATLVSELLPDGGRVLEAGCGAGEQSLVLAQQGYDVTLLDFSSEALARARENFERVGLHAEFILEDAFQSGIAEYDLVFNAGVLEHYDFEQQAALLHAMSSRSRKYVLALVPNAQNYWYWLWRAHKSSQNLWPFGKEIPVHDLSRAFQSARLNYLGRAYLGASWTESFIDGVDGVDPELKTLLIDIHRAGIMPPEQTCYLVAGLGAVDDSPAPASRWDAISELHPTSHEAESLAAALADALALLIEVRRATETQRAEFLTQIEILRVQLQRVEQDHAQTLLERVQAMEQNSAAELAQKIQETERRSASDLARKIDELENRQAEATLQFEQHSAERLVAHLDELERRKDAAAAEKLSALESQREAALLEKLKELEHQQVFDYTGLIRQMEHDHTGVLVSMNLEIAHLRAHLDALRPPLTPGWRAKLHALGRRILIKLRLLPILKRVRHRFRKQVFPVVIDSEVSYQQPVQLGHPDVPPEQRVVILTYTFFDFDGNVMYSGGAERYVLELAGLIREMGYTPELVQCGNGYWVRYYRDLRVTGLDVGGDAARLPEEFARLPHAAALTIFSPFSLAVPVAGASLGISHGVFWDYADYQANLPAMQTVLSACRHLDTIVSVDTNTINWARANLASLAEKFVYVPNFVDVDVFMPPSPNFRRGGEGITILYPRRLYRPRGFWLVAEILSEILDAYPKAEFYFVGQADALEVEQIEKWLDQYPGRVRWGALPPEEMPAVYQQAHITLIPTIHSEGTSLSCLEALAAGNAVVATDVGGLPNLVINGYNGLLINPSALALVGALRHLLDNPEMRAQFGARGREVAQAFSLERWQSQWLKLLRRNLSTLTEPAPRLPTVYFPPAPGIPWDGIKQRPHHLATQLANAGIETFWGDWARRGDSPHPLLHILGPDDEVCLRGAAVIIYYPHHYPQLAEYDQPFVIYDVLDDISIHAESDRVQKLPPGFRAVDYHQKLLAEADLVVTSSRVLYHRIREQRPDALLIPNGVDLAHFMPTQKTSNSAPVIGFHGAIAEWFDFDLLAEVARQRPEYQFRLIGPASVRLNTLTALPNITHRGPVAYEKIPAQVVRFDVGILPFRLNELTHAVRPLKVLEYLAMGIPVVATPLKELKDWPGVFTATTPEQFAVALDKALAMKNAIREDEQVRAFIDAADWGEAARPLVEAIKQKF